MKPRNTENNIVIPPLKWAGGKRWFVANYSRLFPGEFGTYHEPFLGSAAVFFHLLPSSAVLADANIELIETYQAIKDDWEKVRGELHKHHRNHSKSYYYKIRSSKPRTTHTKAGRFIYLNRTCWNGLYRVNLKGEFNVPIGTKQSAILDTDDFESTSKALGGAKLLSEDFEGIIDSAKKGDFVFADPPYTVKHNYNGFIKYNESLFSWDDQERLHGAVVRAKRRGVQIIVTNANHESIASLYKGVGTKILAKRNSVLAASASHRKECEELIIRIG